MNNLYHRIGLDRGQSFAKLASSLYDNDDNDTEFMIEKAFELEEINRKCHSFFILDLEQMIFNSDEPEFNQEQFEQGIAEAIFSEFDSITNFNLPELIPA